MNRADGKHTHPSGQSCEVWSAAKEAFRVYMESQAARPYNDVAVARCYRAWKDASAEARRLCPDGPPRVVSGK